LSLICAILLLIAGFFLKTATSSLQVLGRWRSKEALNQMKPLHFYRSLQGLFLKSAGTEGLLFSLAGATHFVRFGYAICAILFLQDSLNGWLANAWAPFGADTVWFWSVLLAIAFALLSLLVTELLPRIWASRQPDIALRSSSWAATPLLIATCPISIPLLALGRLGWLAPTQEGIKEPVARVKEKIVEMIQEASVQSALDLDEQRLLEAVVTLRDRIVREVMVPRLEMIALPITATIREAANLLIEEGYSRIPLYKESVDSIVGLLHHKDVLNLYLKCQQTGDSAPLDQSVESLAKGILYTPETSRVSHLLHEFRKKQTHLAVVVDEYGGTEGVVTIEDCLEQIVGEISDEFDEEEEELYQEQPGGAWLVDARMTILDIEEEFNIKLPQEGEYDTLGGYLFHCAGEIPTKGFTVQHDEYQIEVVQSDDRRVEKVLITPQKGD